MLASCKWEDTSPFAFQQSSWFGAPSAAKWNESSHFSYWGMCYLLSTWALLCNCHIFGKVAPPLPRAEELTLSWQVGLFLCFSYSCPGKPVCNTRLTQDGWTSTMSSSKAIAESLTIAVWSIRSIWLLFLFNFLLILQTLGSYSF